jgi:glycosyltransferase involved in cell wall biosynthesis
MLKNENIICLSSYYWGPLKQRYEHLMLRFARDNRVLFVEFDGHMMEQFRKKIFMNWLKEPREINSNFHVITPVPSLPLKCTLPVFNSISSNVNLVLYRKTMKKMGFENPVLWLTRPTQLGLIGRMGEKMLVYDCVDEHSGFHSVMQGTLVSRQIKVMSSMERTVLKKADIVFTTAARLYSSKKEFNPNTYLVPNACDTDHFSRALLEGTEIPSCLRGIKHPVVGFYGLLDKNKIDPGLITALAARYRDYSIVLVGPENMNTGELRKYNNIHIIGEVPYENLPNYLKAFDAAILPFQRNEVTENVNPVKIYEYLAAGRSVVCTDFPEAGMFRTVVKIGRDRGEFVELVGAAVRENDNNSVARRLEAVREHTWDNRFNAVSKLLEETLEKKAVPPQKE